MTISLKQYLKNLTILFYKVELNPFFDLCTEHLHLCEVFLGNYYFCELLSLRDQYLLLYPKGP